MLPILIIILSAFLHAAWNALLKKSPHQQSTILIIFLVSGIISTLLVPILGISLPDNRAALWLAVGAGVCEAAYATTLVLSLQTSSLGLAYTIIRSGAMICVWLLSTTVFHEQLNGGIFCGVALVFVGMLITSMIRKEQLSHWRDAVWPYLSAVSIGLANLCYTGAMKFDISPVPLFAISMWVSLPFLLLFNGKKGVTVARQTKGGKLQIVIIAGIICTASFLIFLWGIHQTAAGYATTLRNTSIIFAVFLGRLMGEKTKKRQWLGVILVMLGALLLAYFK